MEPWLEQGCGSTAKNERLQYCIFPIGVLPSALVLLASADLSRESCASGSTRGEFCTGTKYKLYQYKIEIVPIQTSVFTGSAERLF